MEDGAARPGAATGRREPGGRRGERAAYARFRAVLSRCESILAPRNFSFLKLLRLAHSCVDADKGATGEFFWCASSDQGKSSRNSPPIYAVNLAGIAACAE